MIQPMHVLIIGGGGREHALAWAAAQSARVQRVTVAPGNAGTDWPADDDRCACHPHALNIRDIDAVVAFCQAESVGLVIVGPEQPLADGLVDGLQLRRIPAFGPTRAAARIETSKAFAKALMQNAGIPTAAYATFDSTAAAHAYVDGVDTAVVVKADGLAAGKGVIVCATREEAHAAVDSLMATAQRIVIEERLEGPEVSALAFCDGTRAALMPLARDHKRIFEGDHGPNTGGMGAFAPVPGLRAAFRERVLDTVIYPALDAMRAAGTPFVGVLYAGLMLTPQGIRVLEFNCRFGDPETQALLPLLESDLVDICLDCIDGTLNPDEIAWYAGSCAAVVAASEGYPDQYTTGTAITGLAGHHDAAIVFQAGTRREGDTTVTSGGRVLAVSGSGVDLEEALANAYARLADIHFEGMQFRRDIGQSTLQISDSAR